MCQDSKHCHNGLPWGTQDVLGTGERRDSFATPLRTRLIGGFGVWTRPPSQPLFTLEAVLIVTPDHLPRRSSFPETHGPSLISKRELFLQFISFRFISWRARLSVRLGDRIRGTHGKKRKSLPATTSCQTKCST